MVWYSPVFVVEGHCRAWFWRSRAGANHRRSTCASPVMHASQGDSLGVFQGSFGWFWSFGLGVARAPSPKYNRVNYI